MHKYINLNIFIIIIIMYINKLVKTFYNNNNSTHKYINVNIL